MSETKRCGEKYATIDNQKDGKYRYGLAETISPPPFLPGQKNYVNKRRMKRI